MFEASVGGSIYGTSLPLNRFLKTCFTFSSDSRAIIFISCFGEIVNKKNTQFFFPPLLLGGTKAIAARILPPPGLSLKDNSKDPESRKCSFSDVHGYLDRLFSLSSLLYMSFER